jgi:hypothetical protein
MTVLTEKHTLPSESSAPLSWRGEMCSGLFSTKTNTLIRNRYGAELTCTEDAVRVNAARVRWDYTISKDKIERIGRAGFFPWIWTGIRIHHRDSDIPRRVAFVSYNTSSRDIIEECKRLGYPTDS